MPRWLSSPEAAYRNHHVSNAIIVAELHLNIVGFDTADEYRLLNQRSIHEIMILGKVVGTIVTTISHAHYKNRRLLVVQPLIMDGDSLAPEDDFIALDNSQAGIGDTVLVNREGNGARQALGIPDGCVISVIVGIVDSVSVEG